MSKLLRLAAAILALLAVPAFAQTTTPAAPTTPTAPRGAPVAPPSTPSVSRAVPAAPPTASTPRAASTPVATPAASGKRMDINSASAEQLDALPGVGPVRSKAIVAGRPYTDLSDLVTKKILTQSVFNGIKDKVALANINTSSASEMERTLKGVGDVRSKAIVSGRPYATPQDLVTKKVLTQSVFDGMKDLITY